MLEVTLFTQEYLNDLEGEPPLKLEVDYVSLVSSTTHGPPALVAPGREHGQRVATVAKSGDEVLYINTSFIPAWKIERLTD